MVEYINLEIPQGSTKAYELEFTENNLAKDITNWSVYFAVKENMEDADSAAKISKIITSHLDPTNGKTLVELSSSDTDLLGSYYYSFDYKTDDGDEGVLFHGRINFVKSVLNSRI